MKIALDLAGGDDRQACLQGGIMALVQDPTLELTIVGLEQDECQMRAVLMALQSDIGDRVSLLTATEEMPKDIPEGTVYRSRATTMARAMALVEDGQAAGMVSAGNTAGLVAQSLRLGRFKGTKPALAAIIPATAGHDVVYVDAGANPNTNAEQLAQNLRWGISYAKALFGREEPQAAFLNVGIEPGKGSQTILDARKMIEKEGGVRFAGFGNAEPDHVFSGELPPRLGEEEPIRLDIVAADGLSGNIGLKTLKASAKALLTFLKQRIAARSRLSPVRLAEEIAALTLKYELLGILDDYQDKVGGGTMMGIDGIVTKVHGSSKAQHVKGGVLRTKALVENGFLEKMRPSRSA